MVFYARACVRANIGAGRRPGANFPTCARGLAFVEPPPRSPSRKGFSNFQAGGGLPALRDIDLSALVVPLPVAACAQTDQVDTPSLVVLGQRQIRTLPKRIDMVDGNAPPKDRRAFVHAVPAPAFLRLADRLALGLPLAGDVKTVDVSRGDQGQNPTGWPEIRVILGQDQSPRLRKESRMIRSSRFLGL